MNIQKITNYLILIIGVLILIKAYTPAPTSDIEFLKHLDSLEKKQASLIFKLDSLHLLKKEQLNVYYRTKLTYDTLKITIDTMPPLDGTKLLLAKSRQLTNKGIE